MKFEEPVLFGAPATPAEIPAGAPVLPRRPLWQHLESGYGLFCGYCRLHLLQHQGPALAASMRRPCWRRTGTDGAELLLCGIHGGLFSHEWVMK